MLKKLDLGGNYIPLEENSRKCKEY